MNKIVKRLGYIIAISVLIVSGLGFINQNMYNDNDFVKSMWFGNDIVTLFIALPLLLICLIKVNKSKEVSLINLLLLMGCYWYLIYNYIYYSYGAVYNPFFILYIIIIALSFVSLFLIFAKVYSCFSEQIKSKSEKWSLKGLGIFMICFAIIIGGMWIAFIIIGLINNELPFGIEQTGHPTAVVFATDLVFLVTPLIALGILIQRKNVVAIIFTYVILIKCTLYPLVLVIAGVVSYIRAFETDPMTVAYLVLGVICGIYLKSLNKKLNSLTTKESSFLEL